MKVFVTGGTGYVGTIVIKHLLQRGHHVSILQRPNQTHSHDESSSQIHRIEGDIFNSSILRSGMEDMDAVIHLVGIIREKPRRGITMNRIHFEGTKNVLDAVNASGVKKYVHMSALGARPDAISNYHQSKWRSEELVKSSGIPYTIFRPSVIFGKGGPGANFIGQLVDLVRSSPIVPMIGHGHYPLQPVHVETVGDVFCQALTNETSKNKVYEVGGPEVVTYRVILEAIAVALHKRLRTLSIPMVLMQSLIQVLEHIPGFPLTQDQLTMLREGNACSSGQLLYNDFKTTAIPFRVEFNDL